MLNTDLTTLSVSKVSSLRITFKTWDKLHRHKNLLKYILKHYNVRFQVDNGDTAVILKHKENKDE